MEDEKIVKLIENQRDFFQTGKTKDLFFRKLQLKRLLTAINAFETSIVHALYSDMNKPTLEAYASEISVVKKEINYALRHMMRWAQISKIHTPKHLFPSKSYLMPEPWGVTLIISP